MTESTENPPIGERLRAARRAARLTLEQVATRSGLTKGFLSQVERDLASPSVGSLLRVCEVLDVAVGALFESPQGPLVRAADRTPVQLGGAGVEEFQLTPAGERRLVVISGEIAPGGGSGEEAYGMAGEVEFVHVLDGVLELEVDGVGHRLAAGDSLTFDPGAPRRWRNPGTVSRTRVLWVLTPGFAR